MPIHNIVWLLPYNSCLVSNFRLSPWFIHQDVSICTMGLGFDCRHYHPSKIITAEVMIECLLFLQVEEMFFIFLHDILPFARICCSPFFPLMLIIFQLAMVFLSRTQLHLFSLTFFIFSDMNLDVSLLSYQKIKTSHCFV